MTTLSFPDWLNAKMAEKDLRPTDVVKRGGIDKSVLSRIAGGKSSPDVESLKKIANGLGLRIEEVVRAAAGVTPPKDDDPLIAEILHVANQLPSEDQQELAEIAHLKLNRYEKQFENADRKP
jgi:transcriptional regulator with XRE-family HTH domain